MDVESCQRQEFWHQDRYTDFDFDPEEDAWDNEMRQTFWCTPPDFEFAWQAHAVSTLDELDLFIRQCERRGVRRYSLLGLTCNNVPFVVDR